MAVVFWCSAARRSLCGSCLLSRRISTYYSQCAAGRVQDPEAANSSTPAAQSLTATWSDSHCTVANTKNPLSLTRLDRYLASIKAANLEPTLDDIERCRPGSFSLPDSSRYAAEYTSLLETLCRSFSKEQLRRFTELYKLDSIWTRSSRRKTEYAESIIEKVWGWPSLKEIERKRRDATEVLVKAFTVTPSQLFLIMGREGADLLQLSTQYNVHISLTSNPLALRVEGLRGSLKGLTEHISSLKKSIIDEIFELPTGRPIRPDLLQRISRLAGAYVENHGNRGKVRVCARHPNDIVTAKQLALCVSLEIGTQARTVCFDAPNKMTDSPVAIPEPHRYSIYPFITPASLPWTMHSGRAFRLRRVADWLGIDTYEDIASTGGLADNSHRMLNLDHSSGEVLGQLVCPTMPESTSYRQRIITASLGHILISSGDNSQRSILPPLSGTLSLSEILKWVETSGTPLTFVPSVPPAMTTITLGKRKTFHRLVYKTLPQTASHDSGPLQHVWRFELELSSPLSASTPAAQVLEDVADLDSIVPFDKSSSSTDPISYQQGVSRSASLTEALNDGWDPSCQVGHETYVNLMMPDRPMDMQFCIFDWDNVNLTHQPQVLRDYAEKFRRFVTDTSHFSQPDPPSTFNHEGRAYYLYDSLSLKRSNNPNFSLSVSNDCNVDDPVEVCDESIVDIHSAQKTELYQVKFGGAIDGPSWRHFLATCDKLSVASLSSQCKDKTRAVI